MSTSKVLVCAGALLLASPLLAQTRSSMGGPRSTTGSPSSTTGSTTGRGRRQPCWQQAGISQSVIQQHRSIEQNTRSQIEAVCSDSSLTPQQRREKAHQIRQEARQHQDGLLSSQQRAAFRTCREQRGEGGNPGVGNENLCGEAPSTGGNRTAQRNPASDNATSEDEQ